MAAKDPTGGILPEYSQESGYAFPGTVLPGSANRDSIQSAYNSQRQGATDYLSNMKQNSDAAFRSLQNDSQKKLDRSVKNVKNDFNNRGLLNSGLQGDAVAGTRAQANMDLDRGRSDINKGLLQNLNQMEGNAFDTASILAQNGPDTANPYLSGLGSQIALDQADSDMNNQMIGSIGGGIGAGAGTALGAALYPRNQYNPIGNIRPMQGYYDFSGGQGSNYA